MTYFFLVLTVFFLMAAHILGFISFEKKGDLYAAAFTILLSAIPFGTVSGALARFLLRHAFAVFYGMQVGSYLLINSFIVFLLAIFATLLKKAI